jgi:hypothetical protein
MKTEAEIRSVLRQWVLETSSAEESALTDRTPIFAAGLLRSVHILDLILLIEEISGGDIDVERLGPASFKDIDTIYDIFFAAEAA